MKKKSILSVLLIFFVSLFLMNCYSDDTGTCHIKDQGLCIYYDYLSHGRGSFTEHCKENGGRWTQNTFDECKSHSRIGRCKGLDNITHYYLSHWTISDAKEECNEQKYGEWLDDK